MKTAFVGAEPLASVLSPPLVVSLLLPGAVVAAAAAGNDGRDRQAGEEHSQCSLGQDVSPFVFWMVD